MRQALSRLIVAGGLCVGLGLPTATVVMGQGSPPGHGRGHSSSRTSNHGVQEQVEKCKSELRPAQHGIGECVSDFAQHHGNPTPTP
jgi:hypothetical protein